MRGEEPDATLRNQVAADRVSACRRIAFHVQQLLGCAGYSGRYFARCFSGCGFGGCIPSRPVASLLHWLFCGNAHHLAWFSEKLCTKRELDLRVVADASRRQRSKL